MINESGRRFVPAGFDETYSFNQSRPAPGCMCKSDFLLEKDICSHSTAGSIRPYLEQWEYNVTRSLTALKHPDTAGRHVPLNSPSIASGMGYHYVSCQTCPSKPTSLKWSFDCPNSPADSVRIANN